jgi:hypothetical protein
MAPMASKTWDESSIHDREDGALSLHGGIGGLIETRGVWRLPLGAAMTVVLARALLVTLSDFPVLTASAPKAKHGSQPSENSLCGCQGGTGTW